MRPERISSPSRQGPRPGHPVLPRPQTSTTSGSDGSVSNYFLKLGPHRFRFSLGPELVDFCDLAGPGCRLPGARELVPFQNVSRAPGAGQTTKIDEHRAQPETKTMRPERISSPSRQGPRPGHPVPPRPQTSTTSGSEGSVSNYFLKLGPHRFRFSLGPELVDFWDLAGPGCRPPGFCDGDRGRKCDGSAAEPAKRATRGRPARTQRPKNSDCKSGPLPSPPRGRAGEGGEARLFK